MSIVKEMCRQPVPNIRSGGHFFCYNKHMFSDPKKNVEEFGFIPGQTVVDLGSGAGHYALALSKILGLNGHIYCVDIKPEVLVKLKNQSEKEGSSNLEVICGDVSKPSGTKLRDDLADGVILSNVLSLISEKAAAILETKRIIKSGGKVCVVEWADRIKQDSLKDMFIKAGFSFERTFDAGDNHYGLIFRN